MQSGVNQTWFELNRSNVTAAVGADAPGGLTWAVPAVTSHSVQTGPRKEAADRNMGDGNSNFKFYGVIFYLMNY